MRIKSHLMLALVMVAFLLVSNVTAQDVTNTSDDGTKIYFAVLSIPWSGGYTEYAMRIVGPAYKPYGYQYYNAAQDPYFKAFLRTYQR